MKCVLFKIMVSQVGPQQAYNSLFNPHREEGYDTRLSLPSAGLVHKKAVEHGSMTVKLSKPKRDDVNLTLLYIA